MISSTQLELAQERDAIDEVIRSKDMGFDVLRAETYHAAGHSPLEACRRMARECDLYIGVVGFDYGHIIPDLDQSATEFEYETARDDDRTKLILYVKDEDPEVEINPRQQQFRSKVQDFNIGYFRHAKFKTIEELRAQVHGDLVSWVSQRVQQTRNLRRSVDVMNIRLKADQEIIRKLNREDLPV